MTTPVRPLRFGPHQSAPGTGPASRTRRRSPQAEGGRVHRGVGAQPPKPPPRWRRGTRRRRVPRPRRAPGPRGRGRVLGAAGRAERDRGAGGRRGQAPCFPARKSPSPPRMPVAARMVRAVQDSGASRRWSSSPRGSSPTSGPGWPTITSVGRWAGRLRGLARVGVAGLQPVQHPVAAGARAGCGT